MLLSRIARKPIRYVQRDVCPAAAAKYVNPRLGVVRAGNGLYWQHGLIRAEGASGQGNGDDGGGGSDG